MHHKAHLTPLAHSAPPNLFASVIPLALLALVVLAFVLLLVGPAKKGEQYLDSLANMLPDESDRALLRSLYRQKGAKSIIVAWILTICLTPTIAYLYTGDYLLALLSFITGEGMGIWYVVNMFTIPFQVLARNKKAADEAMTMLRLSRPQMSPIFVNVGGAQSPSSS